MMSDVLSSARAEMRQETSLLMLSSRANAHAGQIQHAQSASSYREVSAFGMSSRPPVREQMPPAPNGYI